MSRSPRITAIVATISVVLPLALVSTHVDAAADVLPSATSSTLAPTTTLLDVPATATAIPYANGDEPDKDQKRYIVRYRDTATASEITSEIIKRNGKVKKKLSKVFNGDILDLTPSQATSLAKNTSLVLWLEEDKTVAKQAQIEPSPSWGLDRIDQRKLPGNNIYSYSTTGRGVDAYVIDSGVLATHSQFGGRVRSGLDVFGGTSTDCNGHGTHVAATIAGATYGVAPEASIVAVRALDCNGAGSVSGVITAIDWVITDHTTRPAVMNLSLGTSYSAVLESAVDRAYADGITVVVAAGNSNTDACTTSPSGNQASVLSVGASNEADARASFSNFGKCLDLFAPGTNIVSAGISSTTATAVMSGTSMAAPHVAGLAARYLSVTPTAAPSSVMDAITSAATPNVITNAGTLSPTSLAYGDPEATQPLTPPVTTIPASTESGTSSGSTGTTSGSLLAPPGSGSSSAPSVPSAVSDVVATGGANSSWLTWFAAANGGSPLTSHIVRVYRKGVFQTTVVVDADALHVIPDLRAGSSYSFTVAAMNAVGVGPFSKMSNTTIPLKNVGKYSRSEASSDMSVVPLPPTKVKAVGAGTKTVAIRWTPPTNAKASSFEVWIYQKKAVVAKVVATSTGGIKLFGLKAGRYAIRVKSMNGAGESTLTRSVTATIR